MITTQIELDVSPGGIAPVIHVSQYDTGSRTLQFNLIATAGDLILPTGTKATAAAGKAVCEIVLYTGMPAREDAEASSDFTQLCTANFILFVERAALDKDTVKSGSEIKQLITVIDRTDELLAAAETMDDAKESIRQMTENTRSEMNQLAESIEQNAQELADQSAASARISQIALNSDTLARTALEKATNAENESAETSNSVDNLNRAIARLNLLTQGKVDDAYVEDGFLYMTSDGDVVVGPLGPFSGTGGGGGGTSGNNAHITLTNKSGFLSRTIAQGDSLPITINWSSEEDDIPTGNGTMKVTVGGVVKAMIDVRQGDVTVDVAPYLSAGSSVVKINVADIYGNNRTLNFSITVVVLTLTSAFDDSAAYTGPISFPYVPTGSIQKTMHFLLDGIEIGTAVTVNKDKRITRVGEKLRSLRLDELPQVLDVLSGNMSFVGTRPEAVKYVEQYRPEYYATLLLPAGITSEASIRYKDENKLLSDAENVDRVYLELVLPDKMRWNLEEIKRFSILRELGTMFRTVAAVCGKDFD